MNIVLALILSPILAFLLLALLWNPSKQRLYRRRRVHMGSEYNLMGGFLVLFPVLTAILMVVLAIAL